MPAAPAVAFKTFSRLASLLIMALGGLVLTGWIFHIPLLKSLHPSLISMKFNTAVAFLLSGFSLWLLQKEAQDHWKRRLAYICASVVALLGLLILLQYVFGASFGIDELFIKDDPNAVGTIHPGRMAPNTALNFLLLGLVLLLLDFKSRRGFHPAPYILIPQGLISLFAIIGYAFGAEGLYGIEAYTRMALHTACAFGLLFLAILFARPGHSFMQIISAETVGGKLVRRLLPSAVLILFVLAWMRVLGQQAGYFDATFGSALRVSINIFVFAVFFIWIAGSLHKTDLVRLRAERELQQSNENLKSQATELQRLNKEMESFSYAVSHDLRAPLRSMDGFSQALLEDYDARLDDQGRDYLRRVRAASQHMAHLIDDLLLLSRVTRSEMSKEEVNLSSLAAEVARDLQKAHDDRQVEITIKPEIRATGDVRLLRQVIYNLLENSWKFSAKHERTHIEFGLAPNSGKPTYFVRDDGAGFDMAYANKLFGAFQRLHSSEDFSGTGIGLATIQRIVHRHGGQIWAEGELEKGATFYFTLS